MANGNITGSVTYNSEKFKFYILWSSLPNTAGNYSDVTVTSYWAPKSGYGAWDFDTTGTRPASITIDGSTSSTTKRFNTGNDWSNGNPYEIHSYTKKVYHNSDGSKSITISARANGHAASWGTSSSTASSADCTASGTITLDTIPRASKIDSFTGTDLAGSFSVGYTSYHSGFTNKLRISVPNVKALETFDYSSGTAFKLSTASLDYLYSYMSTTDNITLGAVIETWSGNTKIGESVELTSKFYIPSGIKPTLGSISLDPVNITTADGISRNVLVKDKNQITISASNCSAGDGSTIKSYTFEVLNGSTVITKNTTTSSSVTIGPFSKTGNLKFRVTVTDNRNRSIDNNGSEPIWECYDYSEPKFESFNIYRASDSKGTANMNGAYIQCNYIHTSSSVGGTNSVTVTAYYNGKSQVGSNGAANINLNGDNSTTYKVYLEIKDNYNGKYTTPITTLFGQARVLNITKNGTGVAIGKMAENNELLECRWPAKFNDDCGISGNLTVGSSTQSATPTTGITVHDVRNADITPDSFGDKNVNFYFDQIGDMWQSVMHMKGWDGQYAAWELAGNANNSLDDNTLKYRQGRIDTWGDWQTVLTNKNIGNYALPLSGGVLTGNIALPHQQFYIDSKYGLNCNNSDIVNANGIYFCDQTDSEGEGINFSSNGIWDTLYTSGGKLRFHPNRSMNEAFDGHIIYNSSNFRCGLCTLSSSSDTTVTFTSAFDGVPTVMLTPLTSTSGVIAGKVKSVNSTGFTAIIGGSAVDSAQFVYFAIC